MVTFLLWQKVFSTVETPIYNGVNTLNDIISIFWSCFRVLKLLKPIGRHTYQF